MTFFREEIIMSIIGSNFPRVDAPDKARGRAKYTADYIVPGMLRVALARAKTAHARIVSVEIPEVPEGIYVFTAADLPNNIIPSIKNDQPVLASDLIRYYGEPYAVVAAESREEAEAFAEKIVLVTEDLPAVDDMRAALTDASPKIFPAGNLCDELHSRKGDTEAAFGSCDMVFEDTFYMPVQCHGFLENESAFTEIDAEGRLSLISSTQNAFDDKRTLMQVLGLPADRVTSKAAAVGGAFGGKDGNTAQIYAAIVTHFTGRPAQYVYSREEHIRYGMKRHSAVVTVRAGFDRDARIQALIGEMYLDTGAYALLGPAVLELGTEHMTGPYYIPNVDLDGYLVYTNHTPASAMRGFGGPQALVPIELLLDRAAEHYGLSQLEIRRRNALHRDETGPMGPRMEYSFGFEKALDMLEKTDLYQEMLFHPEPGYGYGVGAALKSFGMGKGTPDKCICEIERLPEDTFTIRISLVDIGQGFETACVMMAAEALGVPPEKVRMILADTDTTVDCGSTAASRGTYLAGNAILKAAEIILAGENYARTETVFPEVPGKGIHSIFATLAELAKVKVDPVTGAVQVAEVVNVTEAGRVINPEMMAGQIFGGIVMSVGYTLSEQFRCENGRMLETSFENYIMPTALDAPHMTNVNADIYEETGPYGAKGVGEASTIAIAPAILSALRKICPGLEITALPVDREQILRYLPGKESL